MSDRCVCCGEIIPEGRQVCPQCEKNPWKAINDAYSALCEKKGGAEDGK